MTFIALIIMSAILAAVPHVIWVLGWLIGLCFGYHMPYAPYGWTAVGLVGVFLLIMLYGIYIGRFQLVVTQHEYTSKEVPEAFNGYKIVHISDLHLGTFDDRPKALKRVVDSINAQEPDLICFTGDIVSMGIKEAQPFADILRELKAKDGIMSILGNHDFLIYRPDLNTDEKRNAEVGALAQYERDSLGWNLLRNEHYVIHKGKDSITIVGVDNINGNGQGFQTIVAGDLPKAMDGTNGFRILLSHDPSHWRSEVLGQDIALTLSGHTHGGQVKICGRPISSLMFRDNVGWYHEGTQSLYVNQGIGCTLPMRINCPEEITVISLRHK